MLARSAVVVNLSRVRRVMHLVEHTELSCDICDTGITREDDGRYRRRVDGHVTPVLFTLIAQR